MKQIISPQTKSIFLAGPISREKVDFKMTWQHLAITLLSKYTDDLAIFCPMPFSNQGYEAQIEWEEEHLEQATVILFWVPRDLVTLPAFTTNVEFGEYYKSGKMVVGFPQDAPKIRYLEYKAIKYGVPLSYTITDTVANAIELLHINEVKDEDS